MNIGIDAHVLGKNSGGVERFLRNVVEILPAVLPQHDYAIFLNRGAAHDRSMTLAPNARIVPLAVSNPLIERSLLLPWLIRRHRLDALLVQRLAPWFCDECKIVLTVHDLTPLKFPRQYRGLTNHLVRLLTRGSVRRAKLILTPTQAVADDIKKYFPVGDIPIRPFYNGVDADYFSPATDGDISPIIVRHGVRRPYALVSGAIEPRRNLEVVYRALHEVTRSHAIDLVVVGSVRNRVYAGELAALADSLGLAPRIRNLGFVDDDSLRELYRHASLFVAASRDEGFNIPVLEAMACGTLAVCSDVPVHRELFSDRALFFAVDSSEDLAKIIRDVLDSPSSFDAQRHAARAHAARFTWRSTSERIAAAFAEAFG